MNTFDALLMHFMLHIEFLINFSFDLLSDVKLKLQLSRRVLVLVEKQCTLVHQAVNHLLYQAFQGRTVAVDGMFQFVIEHYEVETLARREAVDSSFVPSLNSSLIISGLMLMCKLLRKSLLASGFLLFRGASPLD